MGVDVRLLTEDLMALQHVPYEFAELAKTQGCSHAPQPTRSN